MSGLLALLDDVAALTKVAASSLDDVVEQAAHASVDAAGMVIDDAAVTPKYVEGFSPERELPIVWKIAKGSLFNKLVLLLPAALLLSAFASWALDPLLMLGGSYLCYEGAEKVWHLWQRRRHGHEAASAEPGEDAMSAAHLEEAKVRGAVKTDFVLSAEIMTVSLAALETDSLAFEAAVLAVAGVAMTVMVYGSVALLVKADDIGLHLARTSRNAMARRGGRALVLGMPALMRLLAGVGTVAMLWVGASIILHALAEIGVAAPAHALASLADAAAGALPSALAGVGRWLVSAGLDGVLGLVYGLLLVPVVAAAAGLVARLRGGGEAG